MGARAAAASGTPRVSMTSPTTSSRTASARSRIGSTPFTRAATTVGPTLRSGTTARVRGLRSTASMARGVDRPRTTRSPCQRATCPEMSRRACARVRSSCGRVACPTTTIDPFGGSATAGSEADGMRVGVASGDSDREPARSPPVGGSAHPASIAAAATSARSRRGPDMRQRYGAPGDAPRFRTPSGARGTRLVAARLTTSDTHAGHPRDVPAALTNPGRRSQTTPTGAGWTHADTHDRRPVRCDR